MTLRRPHLFDLLLVLFVFASFLAVSALAFPIVAAEAAPEPAADDDERPTTNGEPEEPRSTELFERVRVVGSADRRANIPGSVSFIDEKDLTQQDHSDIHRVLSTVPGVNIQDEEGYGLRPNIGFRGSGAERSSKITLMEDGVLIAPAPYAAPAAYYFPTTGRMEGIEVRKGSSSIQHGPFTNGGVLNLLSSSIPGSFGGDVSLAGGDDGTVRGRLRVGDSSLRFGWLVETYQFQTDGFKDLDGGGDTGVELEDYLVKLRFSSGPGASVFQALEIKLGKTEQLGDETYLGLTQADFDSTPYRRYAASREDELDTDHEQIHLRHFVRPSRFFDVTTTVYRNDFFRNWRKLGKVDGGNGFVGIGDVLSDPQTYAAELAILRGDIDSGPDALNVRNNRRDYYAQGVHAVFGIHPGGALSNHEIELGIRYHEDEEDRYQEEDLFSIADGEMTRTSSGAPASQANRINRAEALAFHAQDTIKLDRWTIIPGVRVEMIDFERLDYGKQDPGRTGLALERSENTADEVIPGVGITYNLDQDSRLFAGIHRGFAPPGPGADENTQPEESVNYEVGYRRSRGPLSLELVGFFNDYDNLLGADTLSNGGTGEGDLFNGGEVESQGLELSAGYDFGVKTNRTIGIPVKFSYTYTVAEFRNAFESSFEAWGDVEVGDRLPYVPEHQAMLGAGLTGGRWSTFASLIYQADARTTAGQGPIPADEAAEEHLLLDLSADYRLPSGLKLFVQIRNLTDETYVAARRPAGARPGLPRTALVGVGFDF